MRATKDTAGYRSIDRTPNRAVSQPGAAAVTGQTHPAAGHPQILAGRWLTLRAPPPLLPTETAAHPPIYARPSRGAEVGG